MSSFRNWVLICSLVVMFFGLVILLGWWFSVLGECRNSMVVGIFCVMICVLWLVLLMSLGCVRFCFLVVWCSSVCRDGVIGIVVLVMCGVIE